jgi:hypothetical protein
VRRRGILGTAWRVIFAAPHGKDQSSFVELFSFSRKRWLSTFSDCGFEAVTDYPSGLFYTGYGLVPSMSLEARRRLARWLGSACRVYVLRRPNG